MNNPFLNPGFSMASLTAAINLIPNRYGRLEALNLFPVKPVRTRQIIVEEYAGRLNLLPTKPPGSPGTVGERGKRKLRSFVIPHIPHDDVVTLPLFSRLLKLLVMRTSCLAAGPRASVAQTSLG